MTFTAASAFLITCVIGISGCRSAPEAGNPTGHDDEAAMDSSQSLDTRMPFGRIMGDFEKLPSPFTRHFDFAPYIELAEMINRSAFDDAMFAGYLQSRLEQAEANQTFVEIYARSFILFACLFEDPKPGQRTFEYSGFLSNVTADEHVFARFPWPVDWDRCEPRLIDIPNTIQGPPPRLSIAYMHLACEMDRRKACN